MAAVRMMQFVSFASSAKANLILKVDEEIFIKKEGSLGPPGIDAYPSPG